VICICSGKETWRPVVDARLQSSYEVSSAGRVRSLTRVVGNRVHKGRIKKQARWRGYAKVSLWAAARRRFVFRVHRLVAYSFLPEPQDYEDQVNHRDGNRMHNCVGNLEWLHGAANLEDRNRRNGWGASNPISRNGAEPTGASVGCERESSRPEEPSRKAAGRTSSSSQSIPF
jgi:hypothetical protein